MRGPWDPAQRSGGGHPQRLGACVLARARGSWRRKTAPRLSLAAAVAAAPRRAARHTAAPATHHLPSPLPCPSPQDGVIITAVPIRGTRPEERGGAGGGSVGGGDSVRGGGGVLKGLQNLRTKGEAGYRKVVAATKDIQTQAEALAKLPKGQGARARARARPLPLCSQG